MRILVTNDDGIDSEGLLALKRALSSVGDVVVIAPDHNWSAAGHTKTLHKPLRVAQVLLRDGDRGYACDGAPSDCVALGMLGIAGDRPTLVVAGINKGANLGGDITYSGTVAAAMEGVVHGLPSIAISLAARQGWDFDPAARFAATLACHVLERGLGADVLLNVNLPGIPRPDVRGVLVTRLGRRIYHDRLVQQQDPFGRTHYWIGGEEPTGHAEEGTDIWAIANGYVSITPIHLDMTSYLLLEKVRGWDLQP